MLEAPFIILVPMIATIAFGLWVVFVLALEDTDMPITLRLSLMLLAPQAVAVLLWLVLQDAQIETLPSKTLTFDIRVDVSRPA